ncbi:MAG: hypothetical protein U0835_06955 [Isosphaeraceae bacterium]
MEDSLPTDAATPDAFLDLLRDHPEWSDERREAVLGRLVERFDAARVVAALIPRLRNLRGADAEAILRLVEAHPEPALMKALADAVDGDEDLPPETAWQALAVLDAAGGLDAYPSLAERWEDLNELLDDGDSVDSLVEQIEEDPEGIWLALQGLGSVEPELRAQIVSGLGDGPIGPGLAEFLRLLSYSGDRVTRATALEVLQAAEPENQEVGRAWQDLADRHPDPAVVECAKTQLGVRRPGDSTLPQVASRGSRTELATVSPRLLRSLVTAIDGRGRGWVVLGSAGSRGLVTAVFECDIRSGVVDASGDVAVDRREFTRSVEEWGSRGDLATVTDAHDLALGLLAGCLTLGDSAAPPAYRFWLEAALGRDFRPAPFRADFPDWSPASFPFEETAARSEAILAACPDWLDVSPFTTEMAVEIRLRENSTTPDPQRDAGAYRVLFERHLRRELERYRRMLLWMAWFWRASGQSDLSQAALALAWQLSDAQHVVPGHPFAVALTTRSLAEAMRTLDLPRR